MWGGGQLAEGPVDRCGEDLSLCVYLCVGFRALKELKSQVERPLDEFGLPQKQGLAPSSWISLIKVQAGGLPWWSRGQRSEVGSRPSSAGDAGSIPG